MGCKKRWVISKPAAEFLLTVNSLRIDHAPSISSISSDVHFEIGEVSIFGQAGATPFGSNFDHLITDPLWASKTQELVTIVCPGIN